MCAHVCTCVLCVCMHECAYICASLLPLVMKHCGAHVPESDWGGGGGDNFESCLRVCMFFFLLQSLSSSFFLF